MLEGPRRISLGVLGLVAVWVVTFWLWPLGEPGIDQGLGDGSDEPIGLIQSDAIAPGTARDDAATEPRTPQSIPDIESNPPEDRDAPRLPGDPAPGDPNTYTVRDGDTLSLIALRLFGTASRADDISRANPLRDPRRLRAGDVIRLPAPQTPPPGGITDAASPDPAETAPALPAAPPAAITYTVRRGDTLSAIAARFYGTVAVADALFEANRGSISSPNALRIGDDLTLPPSLNGRDRRDLNG